MKRLLLLPAFTLAACATTQPQAPSSPLAFTRQVYAHYEHADPRFTAASVYSAHLRHLAAGHPQPDPLCNCPGSSSTKAFALSSMSVIATNPADTTVHVTFENGSHTFRQSTEQDLKIIRENGTYRIDDILYPNGSSYTESLQP